MPNTRVQEIAARAEKATAGPWHAEEHDASWQLFADREMDGIPVHGLQLIKAPKHSDIFAPYWPVPADSEFIVQAREDIPYLLRLVARLTAAHQAVAAWSMTVLLQAPTTEQHKMYQAMIDAHDAAADAYLDGGTEQDDG